MWFLRFNGTSSEGAIIHNCDWGHNFSTLTPSIAPYLSRWYSEFMSCHVRPVQFSSFTIAIGVLGSDPKQDTPRSTRGCQFNGWILPPFIPDLQLLAASMCSLVAPEGDTFSTEGAASCSMCSSLCHTGACLLFSSTGFCSRWPRHTMSACLLPVQFMSTCSYASFASILFLCFLQFSS